VQGNDDFENKSHGFTPLDYTEKVSGAESEDNTGFTQSTKVTVRRRVHGQATKIEREIFYKGAVYIIEEEIY